MKKWNIGWGTVSFCNMNCQFCYSKFKRATSVDLCLEDWINFIDNNFEYINTINYGTGENTLSNDWFTFIDYVRNKYPTIRQALTTNGHVSKVVNTDPRKKDIIIRCIDEMDVSLDFADEEKHNTFRGQPNAYQWALDTLEFCNKYGKAPTIVCLGSAANITRENLAGIFEIAQKYNSLVRMNLYRPTESIDDFSKQFILSPTDLINILYWISDNYKILSISDALFSNLLTDSYEQDPSGIDSIRILPNGDISPSTYLIKENFIVGNIKDKEILKDLSEKPILQSLIYEKIPSECSNCKYASLCKGGVYDRRYLWNQSLDNKDPYCIYTPGDTEYRKIHIEHTDFQSVHHGYLPTMFFAPKGEI